jgi:pyruvate dehydrogenase E2 component (dihydrolipoamide acetyltransferase)
MHRIMTLPKIGVNMTQAVIDEWLVKEGDIINKGDAILVAETDKATQEIFATDSGMIEKLLVGVGDTVACGENIISFLDGEKAREEAATKPSIAKADKIEKQPKDIFIAQKVAETMRSVKKSDRIKISPLAKKTAKDLGLDASKLCPEQPGKRITKSDVIKYENSRQDDAPKREVAVHTSSNNSIAILEIKVCADNMLGLAQKISDNGLDIGYMEIIIKAAAIALKKYKSINANPDEINISVGFQSGVAEPVVMNADKKTIGQIKDDINTVTVGNATFAISNYGAFDIERYVPTQNIYAYAALYVGCIAKLFLPDEHDMPKLTSIIKMTLAFDEGVVDGIFAAKFLQSIKQYIQNPEMMLLI